MKQARRFLSMLLCLCVLMGIMVTTASAATILSIINLTVEAPVAGQKPSSTASVPSHARSAVKKVEWSGQLDSNGAFVEGVRYQVTVTMGIKTGEDCKFSSKSITAKVNEKKADDVLWYANDKVEVIYTFPAASSTASAAAVPAAGTIRDVDITISIPQLGQSKESMPTDAKVTSPAGVKVTNKVAWSGEYVNGKTAEGQAYSAYMVVEIEDGVDAKFARSLNVTINGIKCVSGVIWKSDTKFTLQSPLSLCSFAMPNIAAGYTPGLLPESQGSYDTFDYRAYANIYPDLKAAYGYDAQKLYAHYVNYGKAEGRVGTFISGDNPKTNAPLYGLVPGTDYSHLNHTSDGLANVPATLLDPKPPTKSSELDKWRMEQRTAIYWMSNAKLVAEWNHFKTYMTDDRPGSYKTEAVEVWVYTTVPQELEIRTSAFGTVYDYEHGVRNQYVDEESYQDAKNTSEYKRAIASDTAILLQWRDRFKSLPAPPADPGTAGQKPVSTVGGFSDVFENNYFAQPVVWAVNNKITSGTGSGQFSPNANCTQAQILTFLWRATGSPEPEGTVELEGFDGTEYYYKAAAWAAERDMIGSEFNPEAPCTRAMAVSFMWNYAGAPSAAPASFTDVSANADYAQAVAWAVEQGVTSGTGNNQFSPSLTCTRGQIVSFLYRAFAN